MTIEQQITANLKQAMKQKDSVAVSVMRFIKTAFTNELVSSGKTPQDSIDDASALSVIKRLAKQRKDSIDQFIQGGREDLADVERAELSVLETLLPETMSQDDILPIVTKKQAELDLFDPAKKGILIGAVIKELQGRANGSDIKAVVDSLFDI